MKVDQEQLLQKLGLKKQNLLLLLGMIGIILIALVPKIGENQQSKTTFPAEQAEAAEYAVKLEQKLESILADVSGVGKVRVLVTLQNGYSNVYAKQEKTNNDRSKDDRVENGQKTQEKTTTEQTYVLVEGNGGSKEPLVTMQMEPKIKGVVVVCEGGGNPVTMLVVTDMVRVALGIPSTMVSVSPMSKAAAAASITP